jgi:hypothetical protein
MTMCAYNSDSFVLRKLGSLVLTLKRCRPAVEGKEKVLYVELIKALYGTLKAAKLFWLLLSGKLQEWGFEINKYYLRSELKYTLFYY